MPRPKSESVLFNEPTEKLPGKASAGKVWRFELSGSNALIEYKRAVEQAVVAAGGRVLYTKGRSAGDALYVGVECDDLRSFVAAYRKLALEAKDNVLCFCMGPPPGYRNPFTGEPVPIPKQVAKDAEASKVVELPKRKAKEPEGKSMTDLNPWTLREAMRLCKPVADVVRLEGCDDFLLIRAARPDLFLELGVEGDGELGPLVTDRDAIEKAVRGDVDDDLALSETPGRLVLRTGDGKVHGQVSLITSSAEGFAEPPLDPETDYPEKAKVEYEAKDLHKALTYCIAAMSSDEQRVGMHGVCFDGTSLVSSDGMRIHHVPRMPAFGKWKRSGASIESPILPAPGVKMLHRLTTLEGCKGVEAYFITHKEKGYFAFMCEGIGISAALTVEAAAGAFPAWEQVLPGKGAALAVGTVKRAALLEALDRAAKIKPEGLRLRMGEAVLELAAINPEDATFREKVPVEKREGTKEAKGFATGSVWVDVVFLRAALKPMLDEYVKIAIPIEAADKLGENVVGIATADNYRAYVAALGPKFAEKLASRVDPLFEKADAEALAAEQDVKAAAQAAKAKRTKAAVKRPALKALPPAKAEQAAAGAGK